VDSLGKVATTQTGRLATKLKRTGDLMIAGADMTTAAPEKVYSYHIMEKLSQRRVAQVFGPYRTYVLYDVATKRVAVASVGNV
jgi:muconolactone delta-isomerase